MFKCAWSWPATMEFQLITIFFPIISGLRCDCEQVGYDDLDFRH